MTTTISRNAKGEVRPSVANVKRLRAMAWGDYKHKLSRLGVIASPADDLPEIWVRAWMKAHGWAK